MSLFFFFSNPWIIGGLLMASLIVTARRYSEAREAERQRNVRKHRSPPTYKVRHNGEVMAGLTVQRINQMKAAGQIQESDEYFDPMSGEWVALDLLPAW